jgi:hypothetical protein
MHVNPAAALQLTTYSIETSVHPVGPSPMGNSYHSYYPSDLQIIAVRLSDFAMEIIPE